MPGYRTKTESFTVGDHDFSIRSLLDRQQYDDPQGVAEKAGVPPAGWPLFGVVWPSSLMLADAISQLPIIGLKVLEVGCGIGMASLSMHQRGINITASDYHPLAGEFLAHNAQINQLDPIRFARSDWGKPDAALGTYDLIVGSDILYETGHAAQLSEFMDRHARADALVMIVDPDRKQQGRFSRHMAQFGFSGESEKVDTERSQELAYKGKMLTYTREAA